MELINSDVCGPITPTAHDGGRYFVSFIDDYTHFGVIYIIKEKSEVLGCYKQYEATSTSRFGTQIMSVRMDNGREYANKEFKHFCAERGIEEIFTVPYTPELNGVAERYNRTIMEKARSMIFDAGLEKRFWNEAVYAAVYVTNRSPTRALKNSNATPAEMWFGKKPNLSNLKVFGCEAFVHVPNQTRKKLDSKSEKCIMMATLPTGIVCGI